MTIFGVIGGGRLFRHCERSKGIHRTTAKTWIAPSLRSSRSRSDHRPQSACVAFGATVFGTIDRRQAGRIAAIAGAIGAQRLPDQCLHSAEADVRPPRRKSGFDCVKKTRERHAVGEMRGGPSESPCRRRLQTAMSCFGQKPRW